MEIILKMNNQTEKMTVNIGEIGTNSSCPSVSGSDVPSENSGDTSEGDQRNQRLTRCQQEQALLTVREQRLEVDHRLWHIYSSIFYFNHSQEREARIRRMEERLDRRELELEEKRMILEIAIRVNDFRYYVSFL